jgi:threonine dehydrogenase-like Zn-dependent dehydrogenase
MKALCWMGKGKVEVHNVADPILLNPHDAIIKITLTAICGSDLHLYDGFIPTMEEGDILGHEFMGVVEEVGKEATNLRPGDRVVVPFTIACGQCEFCRKKLWSSCDNTNPNAHLMEAAYGYSGSGLFGYSHMMGGYAGGQAQYVRVPFANIGPLKIESDLPDEKVLFLSDIFPTGYMAAENAQIEENDTVAVWGCGPVGQFAIASAFLLGAARVIAIDRFPERLELARSIGAITVDYSEDDLSVLVALKDLTGVSVRMPASTRWDSKRILMNCREFMMSSKRPRCSNKTGPAFYGRRFRLYGKAEQSPCLECTADCSTKSLLGRRSEKASL